MCIRGGAGSCLGWGGLLLYYRMPGCCHVQGYYQLQYVMHLQLNAFMIVLSHIHFEAYHFWEFCDGSFLIVLARPCSHFTSLSAKILPWSRLLLHFGMLISQSRRGVFQTNYFLKAVIKAYISNPYP